MSVLFDFDGVLADTSDLIVRHAREVSLRLGFPRHPTREDLHALEKMEFADLGRHLGIPEPWIEPFVEGILLLFREDPRPLPVFDGMPEVLTAVSARTRIGIVTGNSCAIVERFLLHHGLNGTVRLIIGLEACLSKDRKILLAAERLDEPLSRLCLVGDSRSDLVAARQAGVRSIAVTWGSQPAERLREENPDHLVHSTGELLALLREVCGK